MPGYGENGWPNDFYKSRILGACVTTQEKSDSGVNIELKKKLTLLENYECLV